MRQLFIAALFLLLMCSCTHYSIPVETSCHPACTDLPLHQIELSSILDIEDQAEGTHDSQAR